MDSRRTPALIALAGVVVAVALFLVLKDDGDDSAAPAPAANTSAGDINSSPEDKPEKQKKPEKPAEPKLPLVEIKAGKPVGGVQEIEFESGSDAAFEVEADASDELHFHGYDLYVDVTPGKPARVEFKADIEGLFELESHSTGELMAEISVVPN